MPEVEHDLMFNSSILYGSGMRLGHETTDLPNLFARQGCGMLRPGSHTDFKGKPLANLYVRMLQSAGISCDKFADSTAPLDII